MGDIMTFIEKLGPDWRKKKIVMAWAYAKRSKSPGVPQAMLVAASLLEMDLTLAYPEKYELDPEYMAFGEKAYKDSGGRLTITNEIYEACKKADIIYAKNWGSLTLTKEEDNKYKEQFRKDWCINPFTLKWPIESPIICILCQQTGAKRLPMKSSTGRSPSSMTKERIDFTSRRPYCLFI
jgi:ornithine carbamoyltransferase